MSEFTPPVNDSQIVDQSANDQAPTSFFKKWGALFVLSLGLAIVIIDTTLLNVSLATIIKDLHTDLKSIQWVITAYALMLAAFTITGGRVGDLFGRKRMFMLGAIIFAVGSFIASIAHSIPVLLLGESIIEGIGAALMMPATSSLTVANFKGKDRATAFGVWGGVAGASSAIGPLLGGYLTTHYSWRWGFRINVFVAALVIIGSLLLLKESRDEQHKPTLDWTGVVLSALGLFGVVFGIIESTQYGWWKAKEIFQLFHHSISFGGISIVPVSIVLGVILIALFLWWEKRVEDKGKTPLMSLSILENAQFISGAVTVSILTLGLTGLIFALPVFLQSVKELDAFHTGLALLPLSIALLIMAPIAGALSRKIAPKYIIQAGLLLAVIAMFVIRAVLRVDMPISHLIPGLVIYGMGMGMVFAPISNLTLSAVPIEQAGEASGVNNTFRQIGTSLGTAIIGAAVLTSLATYMTKGINNSLVIPDSMKAPIIRNVTNPNSDVQFGGSGSLSNEAPLPVRNEITSLVKQSSTQAAKDAYLYGALFVFLGFLTSLFLPKTSVHEDVVVESSDQPKHNDFKIVTAIFLAIVAVAGTIIALQHSSKTVIATGSLAEDIRQQFSPQNQLALNSDSNNSLPVLGLASTSIITITPTPTPKPSVIVNAPVGSIDPRGEMPAHPANSVRPSITPSPTATPTPTVQVYRNDNLGFTMTAGSDWQVKVADNTAVFTSAKQSFSVQSYNSFSGSLSDVQAQLEGSPSVTNVTQTTFHNAPALRYTMDNGGTGIAVISNGRLYYIMGNLSAEPLTTFSFI